MLTFSRSWRCAVRVVQTSSLAEVERKFLAGEQSLQQLFGHMSIREQVEFALQSRTRSRPAATASSLGNFRPNGNSWDDLAPVDMEPREKEQFDLGRTKNLPFRMKVKITQAAPGARILPRMSTNWLLQAESAEDVAAVFKAIAEFDQKCFPLRTGSEILARKISVLSDEELRPHLLDILRGFRKLQGGEKFLEQKIFPLVLDILTEPGDLTSDRRAELLLEMLRCDSGRLRPQVSYIDQLAIEEISDHLVADLIEAVVARGLRDATFFARLENRPLSPRTLTLLLQAKMHFALVGPKDGELAKSLWAHFRKSSGRSFDLITANVLTAFGDSEILNDTHFQGLVGNLSRKFPDLDHSKLGVYASLLDM